MPPCHLDETMVINEEDVAAEPSDGSEVDDEVPSLLVRWETNRHQPRQICQELWWKKVRHITCWFIPKRCAQQTHFGDGIFKKWSNCLVPRSQFGPSPCLEGFLQSGDWSSLTFFLEPQGLNIRHCHMLLMWIQKLMQTFKTSRFVCVILMQVAMQPCEYNWNFFALLLGALEF